MSGMNTPSNAVPALSPELRTALIHKLTALADDELILAHRNSEWTGHAPILEEDIALANIAQDELGHASLWYDLRTQLDGSNPDELTFFRDANAYRNAPLLELPRGDWAFTMTRQYLFDQYEYVYLNALTQSTYQPVADVAMKILKEERFHLQHTQVWVKRLALGTTESTRRMQHALNDLWAYAQQLFTPLQHETTLINASIVPDLPQVHQQWLTYVTNHLTTCQLTPPDTTPPNETRYTHTPHLTDLLNTMQSVARNDPQGNW